MHRSRRALAATAAVALASAALVACTPAPAPSPRRTPSATSTSSPTADPLAGLTLAQEVGQLFVAGTSATTLDPAALAAIRDSHVGGIFLKGRSVAPASANLAVVRAAQAASADGIPLIVSTDQEGGEVQVLQGPGFDRIPTAVAQGQIAPDALRTQAREWGSQLRAAGVNLDLAPVADIVPAGTAAQNPPIGVFQRQYGSDAATVVDHASAFAAGLRDAGVQSTAKHFPGLGHVTANTDTTAGVTDDVVGPDAPDVGVYRDLASSGVDVVMVSSAIYQRIDGTQPAVFSPAVLTLLRDRVGFRGVTMTDDLSRAVQVQSVAVGDRAVRAIDAGVDVVLISNDPDQAAPMTAAVIARAQVDPAFREKVDAAARAVLAWKQSHLAS
ncbi:glycoside hydrolase family 3 N-terminal domain-containing protein [Pseudolysinimonas sp.]|uniref:glycoside hydrolase family 3 N-terminal domain-containing protein n=1 Tax=Pseudolysinimonas sp. TaxID=2680009 RepID=UPI003F7EA3D0